MLLPLQAQTPGTPGGPVPNPFDPKSIVQQALMSSIQTQQPDLPNPPQTPLPPQKLAINPEITQLLLQSMLGTQGVAPQQSLGSILAGR